MKNITNKYLTMVTGVENINDKFWETYEQEKSKVLNPLFKGELIIEQPVEIEKTIEQVEAAVYRADFKYVILESLKETFNDLISRRYDMNNPLHGEDLRISNFMCDSILNVTALAKQVFTETFSFTDPMTLKTINLQKGAKISKALKHFIKSSELDRVQTEYSRIVNDRKITGKLCISIHPLDYLTASVNQHNWESCYCTLGEKGSWCASTLCLLSSPNTVMVYLKSDEDVTYSSNSNGSVDWNNKKWRCFATLGADNEFVHFGRNYPFDSFSLMEKAKEMISSLTGKSYGEVLDSPRKVAVVAPDNMYNDAEGSDIYVAMTEKYEASSKRERINISTVGAVCPACGEPYSDTEFDILCSKCGEHPSCHDCGQVLDESNACYVSSIDEYVCDDCCTRGNYYYCESCEEYHMWEDVVEFQSYWNPVLKTFGYDIICKSCLSKADSVVRCEHCGLYVHANYVTEDGKCFDCHHKSKIDN